MAGKFGIGLDLAPEPGDLHVDRAGTEIGGAVDQLLPVDRLVRPLGEGAKQADLGLGEPDQRLVAPELAAGGIEAERPEAEFGRSTSSRGSKGLVR